MFGEGGDKYTKGLHDGSGEVQVVASRGTGIYSKDAYKSYLRGQGLNWDKWFWDLMRSGDRWAQNGGTESLGRSIASLNSLVNFGNAYTGYTSGANIYGEAIGKGQATAELAFGILGMVPGGSLIGKEAKGAYVVYYGLDAAEEVRYIGITMRNPAIRFAEHSRALNTGRELLRYDVIEGATNLTRMEARIWEQRLINHYGLAMVH